LPLCPYTTLFRSQTIHPRRIHHPPLLPTPKELPQVIKLLTVCYRRSRAFISRRTGGARCEIVQILPVEETRTDRSALIDQPLRRYIRQELHVLLYRGLKRYVQCRTQRSTNRSLKSEIGTFTLKLL